MVTLRNFIKRFVAAVKADQELQVNQNPNQIDLNLLFIPLKKWDPELDLDDLQCMLANLVTHQLVRGYISHEKRILVLGRDAFPGTNNLAPVQ